MGTIRRDMVNRLNRVEADAKVLRSHIERQMDDELKPNDLNTYGNYVLHLQCSIDQLGRQLKTLKDIVP